MLICLLTVSVILLPLTVPALELDKTSDQAGEGHLPAEGRLKEAVALLSSGYYERPENILQDLAADERWRRPAHFLLGGLYKEQSLFEKAVEHLNKADSGDFVLKDYVLRELAETYMAQDEFEKAIQTARKIKNEALLRTAKQYEIKSLIDLKKANRAAKTLSRYIRKYPEDQDYRFMLARLYQEAGRENDAKDALKDIYISAGPLSDEAFKELRKLGPVMLSTVETIERAGNLFKERLFHEAEDEYIKAISGVKDGRRKDDILFRIGMCRFNQKKYDMAAESFGRVKGPRAMYWAARSAYRADDMERFRKILERTGQEYPTSRYFAELLMIRAEDRRRAGEPERTEQIYKNIIKSFPKKREDALWGLGWTGYRNGDYKKAVQYFADLESFVRGERSYKYVYWKAKALEMLSAYCGPGGKTEQGAEGGMCGSAHDDAYKKASKGKGYYSFLSRMKLGDISVPGKLVVSKPGKPEGRRFDRIEMLKLLGMNEEAAEEIKLVLDHVRDPMEFRYLAHTAVEVGDYKSAVYFTEDSRDQDLLALSYPRGYREIVSEAAEKEEIDAYLITALIREESRFDPEAFSAAGAVGLMQLMPATAHRNMKGADIRLDGDSDIYSARKNILIGAHYLAKLVREFRSAALAVAAYNAGESAVRRWLAGSDHKDIEEFIEDIPYKETRRYVKKVLHSYWQYRSIEGLPLQDMGGLNRPADTQ